VPNSVNFIFIISAAQIRNRHLNRETEIEANQFSTVKSEYLKQVYKNYANPFKNMSLIFEF